MLNIVKAYIEQHHLLHPDGMYLVALSGGADSVCLLRVAQKLGYNVRAVHCNFKLRAEESDRDEAFCRRLCASLGTPISVTHFDTRAYASLHKVSLEMAARELRYDYFEQLRQTLGADGVLVAHHIDDNVETVLMNIIRGTGVAGLEGIRPRNGTILRPLLCVRRRDILDYLSKIGQAYVTDSTNLVDDVTRNKVRLTLIPLLQSINPAVVENINQMSMRASEAQRIIKRYEALSASECAIGMDADGGAIDLTRLAQQVSPQQTLYAILSRYGFTPAQTDGISRSLHAQSGKTWRSGSHVAATDRGRLLIEAIDRLCPDIRLAIPECGTYVLYGHMRLIAERYPKPHDFSPSKDARLVTLDADKVRFPILIRNIRIGDRFAPYGMRGTQLCSDYLTNRKRDYFQRQRQLVVEDATGNIIWLVGERVSQMASCSDNTINVLALRYIIDEP